jgi:hypothetical protein
MSRLPDPVPRTGFASFEQFWPHYVGEHGQASTRWLHFSGTLLALVCAAAALALARPLLWLAVLPLGYGPAWIGHFFVEHNRPATFRHPLWSLRGDLRMFGLMATGRMGREVERLCGRPGGRKTPQR